MAVLLVAWVCLPSVPAATLTWSTSPGSATMATSTNWNPNQAPAGNDFLVFGTSSTTSLNNNITANTAFSLTFLTGASAYTLSGNAISLTTSVNGGTGITNNSSNLQTLSFNIGQTNGRSFTTSSGGGDLLFTGNITNGAINIAGTGVTTLSGTNTSNPQIMTVNAGATLRVSQAANFNSSSVEFRLNGNLDLRNDSSTNFSRSISLSTAGDRTINVDRAIGGTGNNQVMTVGTITANNNDNTVTITGSNGYGLTAAGFTTATLAGTARTNSFVNNAPGTFTIAGDVALNTNSTVIHTLRFSGSGNSVVEGDIVATNTSGTSGNFRLVKEGDGRLTVNGDSNHKGVTNVNGGTLLINGDFSAATGAVTVAAGAILGGSGTLGGATTIDGSLRPGNSIGTLIIDNDVTWNANNAWVFELGAAATSMALADAAAASSNDRLSIGGNFLKGTGSAWTFDFSGAQLGWYKLVEWDGTTDFTAGLNTQFIATGLGGFTGEFTVDAATSALYLTVIPEPSTGILLTASLAAAAIFRFRRNSRK